ncbi:MAG: PAS domain-containing protein [Clostridia bacterium]|nr:PAS domain-containing protein [Clostridia bacterium]
MKKEINGAKREGGSVKRPIQRTVLLRGGLLMLLLCILFLGVSYYTFSRTLYRNFNDKLDTVITYVENQADPDDLANCVKTGVKSEKYLQYQKFLNTIVDDLRLDYLYIVIPEETVLVNVISATSAAEFAEGAVDMEVNEATDAYTPEELQRYRSFWDSDKINYFEETSDYGAFYTACKPMRDSNGETVGLICVDLSSEMVHGKLNNVLMFSAIFAVLSVGGFGVLVITWLRKKVTNPILALEVSTREYAKKSRGAKRTNELSYNSPNITSENEVQSLGEAITQMTEDIRVYVDDALTAERRADQAEQESQRLALEAEATRKISELSNSLVNLISNIPAMTYTKDIETGKYLACNRKFAAYANKTSPEEVEGLTDYDLFEKATADSFAEYDKRMLEMDGPYIYFEEATDPSGNPRQFQTTKLKYVNTSGKTCVLGMSVDVTEMMKLRAESERAKEAYEEAKSASVTYSNIARALSLDYTYLYYINLETDEFIEYHSDKKTRTFPSKDAVPISSARAEEKL